MRTDRHLVAACGDCIALCCTLLAFDQGDEFAFSKPADVRCPQLLPSCRCAIHGELAARGQSGCAAYTCHGAGPRATTLFAATLLTKGQRYVVFATLCELHELLWLVSGAARLSTGELRDTLIAAADAIDAAASGTANELAALDLEDIRATVRALMVRVRAAR